VLSAAQDEVSQKSERQRCRYRFEVGRAPFRDIAKSRPATELNEGTVRQRARALRDDMAPLGDATALGRLEPRHEHPFGVDAAQTSASTLT
jgi:hypothetical protein